MADSALIYGLRLLPVEELEAHLGSGGGELPTFPSNAPHSGLPPAEERKVADLCTRHARSRVDQDHVRYLRPVDLDVGS